MSKKTDVIADDVRDYFDRKVEKLSQADYYEVLQNVIGMLESQEDCVKEEMQDE